MNNRTAITRLLTLLTGLFLISIPAMGGSLDRFTDCGEYKVQGNLTQEKDRYVLIVFGKTLSKTELTVTGDTKTLKPLSGKKILAQGVIASPVHLQRGSIQIQDLQPTVTDYLDPSQGDGFWLVKKLECKTKT